MKLEQNGPADPLAQVDPRVVAAALAPLLLDERRQRIEELLESRLGGLTVVLENLHDPHNGAAVLRSAEALGLQTVHVVETQEPFRFSTLVSQGCERWLDIVRHPTLAACRDWLRARGFRLYAAVPGATLSLDQLDFSKPAALLLGNEHAGLTEEAIAGADAVFGIPLYGMTRSLNLSVASALGIHTGAARRRQLLGKGGDLDEAERARLRARFYREDVRGAEAVVRRYLQDHPTAP